MADDKIRELERKLAQNPSDVDAKRKWLMAKARTGAEISVKTYYKIRCDDKWLGTSNYEVSFNKKTQGTRFNSETEAIDALLRYVKRVKRQVAAGFDPLAETSVEIVCFEIHTIEANTKTVNLVDAAQEAALLKIRREKEELEKHQQELLQREKALLENAGIALQDEVKAKRKPRKKKAVKKKAKRKGSENLLDW